MSTTTPKAPAKARTSKVNALGLSVKDYQGLPSTLCKGCGHDAISSSLIKAVYELDIEQHRIAKLSGIGCSSKTPAYFFNGAHGFNSVHGRMAAIATGVSLANRDLISIGVSGDGDTASIGLGHFCHMIRRQVPMVYIVENNGCYGLTKGQMSATADRGSAMKGGVIVEREAIDLCSLAVKLGCGYVARSFSGDTNQVRNLIKGALAHNGTAFIDIISPCVTFNDHDGSTKSRTFMRDHQDPLHEIDFIAPRDQITIDYAEGETQVVEMHDGSKITLKKLDQDYDPTDRSAALNLLEKSSQDEWFPTGLVFANEDIATVHDDLRLSDTPLAALPAESLRPSNKVFEKIMASYQ